MSELEIPALMLRTEAAGNAAWTSVKPNGVMIGRKDTCDVVLVSVDVSRKHAEIRFEDGRWIARDLGSANGTFIGGKRITTHVVKDGDRLRIGGLEILCRLGGASAEALVDPAHAAAEACLDMRDFTALVSQVLDEKQADVGDGTFVNVAKPAAAPKTPRRQDARRVLQILHGAADALMQQDELDATLARVVELVFEHLPAERCFVLLYDAANERLVPRIERVAKGASSSELRISRNIADTALRSKQSVLVRDAAADARFAAVESIVQLGICSAMCAPLCHKGRVGGLIYVDRTSGGKSFTTTELGALSILAAISAAAVERAQMRETLAREQRARERLSRYHAPLVVDRIVRSAELDDGAMEAEEREVSVLFADLSGFTALAESMSPRDVTSMLNQLFELLTEEVFREAGTLDKFIGDALMAFFGAPLPQPDHALRAVRAARAMMQRLESFNASRPSEQRLGLRIGVNSGPVIVGDVGALQRRDYTVIGDTVNVASRLESSVARLGQIVIGAPTYAAVRDAFACTELAPVVLKGRTLPFQPYLLEDPLLSS